MKEARAEAEKGKESPESAVEKISAPKAKKPAERVVRTAADAGDWAARRKEAIRRLDSGEAQTMMGETKGEAISRIAMEMLGE